MGGIARFENEVRFGFSMWDWKGSPNVEHLDRLLRFVDRGAGIVDLSDQSGSDSFLIVIHSGELALRPDQWYDVYRLVEGELREDDVRLKKYEREFAHRGGQTYAMKRENLEEFVHYHDARTIKITDPDIALRGKPFIVDNDGKKVFI